MTDKPKPQPIAQQMVNGKPVLPPWKPPADKGLIRQPKRWEQVRKKVFGITEKK